MDTTRVIDLLVNIANGKEVPKKILYNNYIYEYENYDYFSQDIGYLFDKYNVTGILNDTVTIIGNTPKEDRCINVCGSLFTKSEYDELAKSKEDEKIEKLECLNTDYFMKHKKYGALTNEEIVLDIQTLKHYINKLIDKVSGE